MIKENNAEILVRDLDISALSTEVAGGFVGCTIGMYAEDIEKRETPIRALFKSFSYKRLIPVKKDADKRTDEEEEDS